jgi:hypothetical protein
LSLIKALFDTDSSVFIPFISSLVVINHRGGARFTVPDA